MATLVPDGLNMARPGSRHHVSLRDWLVDDWALIFSHPRDFGHDGFESDRWQYIVRDLFRNRHLRPVSLATEQSPAGTDCIAAVTADDTLLALSLPAGHETRALRERLVSLQGRFVLVIDGGLQARAVLRYVQSRAQPLSPLDLLPAVDALRCRASHPDDWATPRRDYIPC